MGYTQISEIKFSYNVDGVRRTYTIGMRQSSAKGCEVGTKDAKPENGLGFHESQIT